MPIDAATLFPAKDRRISGCAPRAPASHRLLPILVLSSGTNPFDNPGVAPRSASPPNGPARPSLPTTLPRVAGDLDSYDSSPPAPNRRVVCHLCDESNVADTCCDATIPRDKSKRVGRHYMHISAANDTASQHPTTNERTCRAAVHAIVLKKIRFVHNCGSWVRAALMSCATSSRLRIEGR